MTLCSRTVDSGGLGVTQPVCHNPQQLNDQLTQARGLLDLIHLLTDQRAMGTQPPETASPDTPTTPVSLPRRRRGPQSPINNPQNQVKFLQDVIQMLLRVMMVLAQRGQQPGEQPPGEQPTPVGPDRPELLVGGEHPTGPPGSRIRPELFA